MPLPTNLQQLKQSLADDDFFKEINSTGAINLPLTRTEKKLAQFLTVYEPLIQEKKKILKLSRVDINLPILILGETGTGKELIAEALHGERQGQFVPVNCSGIPSELLESEFFGSVRGAFTGAIDKTGYIKAAENGTLFLDEIGDMPPLLQSKLLRVIQSRKFRRVGATEEEPANFRLVSATNKTNLESCTNFRSDLYYRLAGHVINLPNLDQRGDKDIDLIITLKAKPELLIQIKEHINRTHFPGNIRQLLNIIEEYNILLSP